MPCTDGGTPATMEVLLTLVNDGSAPRARPRWPATLMRWKFGIRWRASAASRYSSAEPSRQTTTTGRGGGWYRRWLTTNGFVAGLGMAGLSAPRLLPRIGGLRPFLRRQASGPPARWSHGARTVHRDVHVGNRF